LYFDKSPLGTSAPVVYIPIE